MKGGSEDTRLRILEAARRLLDEGGPGDVTMSEIAREAGFSRQAVYLHFGSRAGLLVALVEHLDDSVNLPELVAWTNEAQNGAEMLERVATVHASVCPKLAGPAIAIERAALTDEDARAAWDNRMESRLRGFEINAGKLLDWGELQPGLTRELAIDLIYSLLSWAMWRLLVDERGWSADEYEEHIGMMLKRVLLAGNPEARGGG